MLMRSRLRSKTAHFIALAAILALCAPAGVAKPRHRSHHHHRRAVAREVTVTPSEAIEERVENEIQRGEDVLDHLGPDNLFASRYLVSAIVYHDGFLNRFPKDKATADPSRRIIAHLTELVTPEVKQQYMQMLRDQWSRPVGADIIQPVNGYLDVQRLRRNHHDAIDIFAPEGSPVHAAAGGIVLLADNGWGSGDLFAVTSLRGGNSVVIFDPAANRFYRYCHLAAVNVQPGETLSAGQVLGIVGHTGFNADRRGHGGHLHFEVNQYDGHNVRALDYHELLSLWRAASPARMTEDTKVMLTALPRFLLIP